MKMVAVGKKDSTYSIQLLPVAHLVSYPPNQDPIPGLALALPKRAAKAAGAPVIMDLGAPQWPLLLKIPGC